MNKSQFIDEFEDYLIDHDYHAATLELLREKFDEYDSLVTCHLYLMVMI